MKHPFQIAVFSISLLISTFSNVNAQSGQSLELRKNAMYGEWYGNGVYYSLNYERILHAKEGNRLHLAGRIGAMAYPNVFFKGKTIFVFPLEFNLLTGKREHKLEFGMGTSATSAKFHWPSESQRYYRQFILFTRVGYRYYLPEGIICRIGLLPLIIYKLGYIPDSNEPNFGILQPSTSGLINDNSFKRFSLGISAGLTFGYSF